MIEARGIRKKYGTLEVLKGVELTVARGEVVSIVGASGAGKTTLLQILGTLERPDSGHVLINGEQQRIAVARALFNDPSVVLADEPSGNLESAHARELHQLFFDLRRELGQTFVIVTHNGELAAMADRKLTMQDGAI